jgi:hypothetical protein
MIKLISSSCELYVLPTCLVAQVARTRVGCIRCDRIVDADMSLAGAPKVDPVLYICDEMVRIWVGIQFPLSEIGMINSSSSRGYTVQQRPEMDEESSASSAKAAPPFSLGHMSSVPATPTISTISSSDLSFEDIPPMSADMLPPSTAKEHPTLFIHDDMVTIQVRLLAHPPFTRPIHVSPG